MANKPTYEELAQRVKELEKEALRLKNAEEALQESEERYHQLFENASDAVMIFDSETLQFEDANQATLDLYGFAKEEFLNLNVEDISAEKEKTRVGVQKVKDEDPDSKQVPLRYLKRKNGVIFPGEIYAGTFVSKGRKKIIGVVRDITERKKAEDALMRQARELGERIKELDCLYAISGLIERDGISLEDIFQGTVELIPPAWQYPEITCARLILEHQVFRTEKFKETIWTQSSDIIAYGDQIGALEVFYSEEKPEIDEGPFLKEERNLLNAIARRLGKIIERKLTEGHVHTLTQQLMKAQESERQRISRDLHDNLAQELSTLKIGLDTLLDNEPGAPLEKRQRVSELSKKLQGTIMSVRDLAYDLRPPSLDQLGLVRTVFQYCEDFSEKSGVRVDFFSAAMDDRKLGFDTEINLYRLIQEALNNIKKHAEARRVTINLVASSPSIILRIEDDGRGFDMDDRLVTAMTEKRMGLRSMEERVSLLQGKMRIQSRPTRGTRIFVEVPYKEKQRGSKEKHPDRG